MKNQKGVFTAEASIVFSMIFLIVFTFLTYYLYQFYFYEIRGQWSLQKTNMEMIERGLYIDRHLAEGELRFLNKRCVIRLFDQDLDYLRCTHHYLIGKEVQEAANVYIENY